MHRPKETPFLQSSDQDKKSGKGASGIDKRIKHLSITDRLKVLEMNGVSYKLLIFIIYIKLFNKYSRF